MIQILVSFQIYSEAAPDVMAALGEAIAKSPLGDYDYDLEPKEQDE